MRVAHDLQLEPGQRQEQHTRKSAHTRLDFLPDLILEEPGVFHHFMVEDEIIGQSGEEKIEDVDADSGNET